MALAIGGRRKVRIVELAELNPAMEYYVTCSAAASFFYLALVSMSL